MRLAAVTLSLHPSQSSDVRHGVRRVRRRYLASINAA